MDISFFGVIFINVKSQHDIQEFAKIVHLYFIEGIFSRTEAEAWMGEIKCELVKITKHKLIFNFFDEYYPTRMTIYQSGRIVVETDLDSLK